MPVAGRLLQVPHSADHASGFASGLLATLSSWSAPDAAQARRRAEYLDFLRREQAGAIDRDLGRAHVTGSAVVLSPDIADVLLCLHRRAGMWLQLGGHVEAVDDSVLATARREAEEEAGLLELHAVGTGPADLDRHPLGAGFARCDVHWDVGHAFIGVGEPVVSDESDAVRWWPVDRLPQQVPPRLAQRIRRARDAAAGPG